MSILASTTVADREPVIHLGNARLLELEHLNLPADATSLYQLVPDANRDCST